MASARVVDLVKDEDMGVEKESRGTPESKLRCPAPRCLLEANEEAKRFMEHHVRMLMEIERDDGRRRAKRPA